MIRNAIGGFLLIVLVQACRHALENMDFGEYVLLQACA